MYQRTTANRSGKITVEIHDNLTASGFIDGDCVLKNITIFKRITPRELVKGKWKVSETKETYLKKFGNGAPCEKEKLKIHLNPLVRFCKSYGVTPSHFCRIFNSAVWKCAISPYKEFQSLYFGGRGVRPAEFTEVVKNHDLLLQAISDGQKNILPILARTGKSPQELKKEFGKGLWKALCSNSFYRNKLLIESRKPLVEAIKYGSGALRHRHHAACQWVKSVCKIPFVKIGYRDSEDIDIFMDTKRLAENLNLDFNEKWSKLKMKEKHDEYVTLLNQRLEEERMKVDDLYRLKVEKLKSINLSKVYPQIEFELNGVSAKILTTYDEIIQEGRLMNHCVGSYTESSLKGKYAVVHLSGDNEETTLGLLATYNYFGNIKFNIQQHYGKYNSKVKSENHINLAKIVEECLNSVNISGKSFEQFT